MQKLKFGVQDLDLLSSYLHDSYFVPDETRFDADTSGFTLKLRRIGYEFMEEERDGYIRVFEYPYVDSTLKVAPVESVLSEWVDRPAFQSDEEHVLMSIVREDEGAIKLCTDDLKVSLTTKGSVTALLEDTRVHTYGPKAKDIHSPLFRWLDEIEKLRVSN